MNKQLNQELRAVEVVDVLMMNYRNGVEPSKDLKLEAYELGIDVKQLELYITTIEKETEYEEW